MSINEEITKARRAMTYKETPRQIRYGPITWERICSHDYERLQGYYKPTLSIGKRSIGLSRTIVMGVCTKNTRTIDFMGRGTAIKDECPCETYGILTSNTNMPTEDMLRASLKQGFLKYHGHIFGMPWIDRLRNWLTKKWSWTFLLVLTGLALQIWRELG